MSLNVSKRNAKCASADPPCSQSSPRSHDTEPHPTTVHAHLSESLGLRAMRPTLPPHSTAVPTIPQYPGFPSSLNQVDPPTPVNHPPPRPVTHPPPPPPPPPPPVNHPVHSTPIAPAPRAPEHHQLAPPSQHGYIPPNYIAPDRTIYHPYEPPRPNPAPKPKPTSKHFFPHVEYTPEAFPEAPPIVPNTAPPGHFDLLPPPNSSFPSWEALYKYAQEHASVHGYALSINTTEKNRCRVKLCCVCYGKPKNTRKLSADVRVRRNRTSQKTGCRMNLDCKKHASGKWTLRVRQGSHNHAGRGPEAWSLQRKRTWGAEGRHIGTGGVIGRLERSNGVGDNEESTAPGQGSQTEEVEPIIGSRSGNHYKAGSLVWKIVEQEMLVKLGPGHGRDRGVGRTVRILEEKLPGITIFKRDVYNIRAQIRRMRKEAGEEIGQGLEDSEDENVDRNEDEDEDQDQDRESDGENANRDQSFAEIDPGLIAQCNSALQQMPSAEEEAERLREEVRQLKASLDQYKKDLETKSNENGGLRMQLELANMAMYNIRGPPNQGPY